MPPPSKIEPPPALKHVMKSKHSQALPVTEITGAPVVQIITKKEKEEQIKTTCFGQLRD